MAKRAVARETVCALRRTIARIEGTLPERLDMPTVPGSRDGAVLRHEGVVGPAGNLLPTGVRRLDAALGGGLPFAALTELHGREARDAGAVAGFALALASLARKRAGEAAALLWVTAGDVLPETGAPYAPGILRRFAIAPASLLVADARRLEDALWIAEEAAALTAFCAVLMEVRGPASKLDLTATRRLHRRARQAGRPFFLMRQAGRPEPTAAPVRLVVAPAPAGERKTVLGPLEGSIGPPAFTVTVARSRLAIPATVTLEWNEDEHAFHDRTAEPHGAQDAGAVVSVAGERAHPARAAGTVLAFKGG